MARTKLARIPPRPTPAAPRTWRKSDPPLPLPFRTACNRASVYCASIILYDTFMRRVPLPAMLLFLAAAALPLNAAKTLDIYFIDTEGGQATLIAAPSGQTLLVDTGYAGNSGRDADRIALAAKAAG